MLAPMFLSLILFVILHYTTMLCVYSSSICVFLRISFVNTYFRSFSRISPSIQYGCLICSITILSKSGNPHLMYRRAQTTVVIDPRGKVVFPFEAQPSMTTSQTCVKNSIWSKFIVAHEQLLAAFIR